MTTTTAEPRFKVTSLTGYTINPATNGRERRPVTTFYVLDRAYCHRTVATFDSGPTWSRSIRAHSLAAELNGTPPPRRKNRFALRRWLRRNRLCVGCGCPYTERTTGCVACYARHYAWSRKA